MVLSATSPPVDLAIARVARRQRGLIRIEQLRTVGLSDRAVGKRVRAGKLHRLYRGVYAVGHTALSREGQFLAAVYAAGEGAVLSHDALAEHYEVRRERASLIDVVVPRKRKSPPGTRFHEANNLDPRDVTTYKGIPATTIPRLLVDLSDRETDDELANVIHEAAFRGWFHEPAIRAAMARANGRRNLDALERALELRKQGSAGTKSRAERALRARLREQGIESLPNVTLEGFEVDVHVPGTNLVLEVDGTGHGRPRTKTDDETRDAVLAAAGFEVVRLPTR